MGHRYEYGDSDPSSYYGNSIRKHKKYQKYSSGVQARTTYMRQHPVKTGFVLGLMIPAFTFLCFYHFLQYNHWLTQSSNTGDKSDLKDDLAIVNRGPIGGLYAVVIATGQLGKQRREMVRDTWGSRVTRVKFFMDERTQRGNKEDPDTVTIPDYYGQKKDLPRYYFPIRHICETEDPAMFSWFFFSMDNVYLNMPTLQRYLQNLDSERREVRQVYGSTNGQCMNSAVFILPGKLIKDMCSHIESCLYSGAASCLALKVGVMCTPILSELIHFASGGNYSMEERLRKDENFTRNYAIFTGIGLTFSHIYLLHRQNLKDSMKDKFKTLTMLEKEINDWLYKIDAGGVIAGVSQSADQLTENVSYRCLSGDGSTAITPDNKVQIEENIQRLYRYLYSSGDTAADTFQNFKMPKKYQLYTGQMKHTEFQIHGFMMKESDTKCPFCQSNRSNFTHIETRRHFSPQRILRATHFGWPDTLWILLPVTTKQDLKNFLPLWESFKHTKLKLAIKVLILQMKQSDSSVQPVNLPSVIEDKSIYNIGGELRQLIPHNSISLSLRHAYANGIRYIDNIYKKHIRKTVALMFMDKSFHFGTSFLRRCVGLAASGVYYMPHGRKRMITGRQINDVDGNTQIGYAEELLDNGDEKGFDLWKSVQKEPRCVGLQYLPHKNKVADTIDNLFVRNMKSIISNDPDLIHGDFPSSATSRNDT